MARVTTGLGVLVLALWSLLAWQRVPVYSGDLPLWEDATRLAPTTPRPWIDLGSALSVAHRQEDAARAWTHGLALAQQAVGPPHDAQLAQLVAAQNLASYYSGQLESPPSPPLDAQAAALYFDLVERLRAEMPR